MVKFEELENKIRQSRGSYSLTDDGQGKKIYTIFSEDLKQSLRDIIHSTARAGEWKQIDYTTRSPNLIKYKKEQNGKFGIYQKNMVENSSDEFVVFSEGQNSTERKEFEESSREMRESKQRMEESRRNMEASRRQIEESEQAMENSRRQIENSQRQIGQGQSLPRSGEGFHISVSGDERIIRQAAEILAREGEERAASTQSQDNQNQQQAQIRQNDNSNFFLTF